MSSSSYKVKVPGKLMIAGEYAVLEPGQKAVVVAVNRYVTAIVKPCNKNMLAVLQHDKEDRIFEISHEGKILNSSSSDLRFVQNAIFVVYKFMQEKSIKLPNFQLQIESNLNDPITGKKYGLGSSAAVVVAVVSAILNLNGNSKNSVKLDEIFKLSVIAHLRTQGNGSGADIAAAVYGGWLEYSAFNTKWVLNELEHNEKLTNIVEKVWPDLSIKSLTPPSELRLAVGWTEEKASTSSMVNKFQSFRDNNFKAYNQFLNESFNAVDRMIHGFKTMNCSEAMIGLSQNRNALLKLSKEAHIDIETEKLKYLCSIAENFGRAKSSGAGGGDCGIVFLKDQVQKQHLYEEWEKAGIVPLNLSISKGMSIIYEN